MDGRCHAKHGECARRRQGPVAMWIARFRVFSPSLKAKPRRPSHRQVRCQLVAPRMYDVNKASSQAISLAFSRHCTGPAHTYICICTWTEKTVGEATVGVSHSSQHSGPAADLVPEGSQQTLEKAWRSCNQPIIHVSSIPERILLSSADPSLRRSPITCASATPPYLVMPSDS